MKKLSTEQLLELIKEDVFEINDFERHIQEMSVKMKIPAKTIRTVLEQYLSDNMREFGKVRKIKRRFSFYGHCHIEIWEYSERLKLRKLRNKFNFLKRLEIKYKNKENENNN